MKFTRIMLLVFVVAISLGGLTAVARAQQATTQPAGPAITAAPAPTEGDKAGADTPPTLTEDDKSGGETGTDAPKTSPSNAPPTSQPVKPRTGFLDDPRIMILMAGGIVLMFVFSSKSKRKGERKRKEMLSTLKKGDKVTTIGGIIGTVMEVRDDEVVLKIDESNNTRMRFARRAIHNTGVEDKSESGDEKK